MRRALHVLTLLLGVIAVGASAETPRQSEAIRAEFEEIARQIIASDNPHHGRAQLRRLEQKRDDPRTPRGRQIGIHAQLSFEHLRLGNLSEATRHLDLAFGMVGRLGEEPGGVLLRLRVIVELRRAEVANCIQQHHRDCCIFPLAGGGLHSEKLAASRVSQSLLKILEDAPDQLDAQWLLNISEMAQGQFPDSVPPSFRLPPEGLESEDEIGRFIDVAPDLGLDALNLCGGAVAEDFDNDGDLDIVTTSSDPSAHAIYYQNSGDGTFDDQSDLAGLGGQLGGLNCIGADYDNDGDVDLLILRGAWMEDHGRIRNSLLRNEGVAESGGAVRFTDVTRAAGLAEPAAPTQAAVWGDFDNDGDLDLFVGNEARERSPHPSQLFRNNGDGTFTDLARAAGVTNDRLAKGVTAGDYDNDGDLDLYVSNLGVNRMYRNDTPSGGGGPIRFTDVAVELGVGEPGGRSFAPWFFDFNNDGWLDLFVTAYDATTANLMRDYRGLAHGSTPPRLYLNRGGRFEDIASAAGLDHAWLPMGASFGDIDNDGYLDIYLATGDPNYETLMPNVMLRNQAGQRFLNVTTSGGLGHLQKGHGICFADFDHDGDQDLFHQLGGFFPGDKFHNALFLNPGGGGRFLVIELEGTDSNRGGVGARIAIGVDGREGPRTIHRAVGSVSSFGGSPVRRQEIGLGGADLITSLSVTWAGPGGEVIDRFEGVPVDSHVRIRQGSTELERLEREPIPLDPEKR